MAILKPFQLAIACECIEAYPYDRPFSHFFSALAKQHKNWGSKDRKTYRNACYAYFRLGKSVQNMPLKEAVQMAWDIAQGQSSTLDVHSIFPDYNLVSPSIDADAWLESHLYQKPAYLVMHKHKVDACVDYCNNENIPFEICDNLVLKLPADAKADYLVENGLAWVMDRASAELANQVVVESNQTVWDACSGAGGKSLFLSQKYDGDFNLICSDLRFSILENLKQRFLTMKLTLPQIELTDLTESFQLSKMMDVIVLDVPCTGSGTWGRSPESILRFDVNAIGNYAKLQRKIASNAVKNLKKGGSLYYMTCSVFDEENEKNVELIAANHQLKVQESKYINFGFRETDTLYFAHLTL